MGKGRRYDQEYKDMIVELFKSGMSLAELSSEYSIAKSTINGWIKDVKEIKIDENEVHLLTVNFPKNSIYYDEYILSMLNEKVKMHIISGGKIL